jgi:protein associated with RNAse G/E
MSTRITEIKRNIGKPDQTFICHLVHHGKDRIVLSYVSDRPYRMADMEIPTGTRTLAYYQEGFPYIIWEMTAPDGRLLGYYVHLCENVRVDADRVTYRDMLLDVWFDPDGAWRLLDADELDAAFQAGHIDRQTVRRVRLQAEQLPERYSEIRRLFAASSSGGRRTGTESGRKPGNR